MKQLARAATALVLLGSLACASQPRGPHASARDDAPPPREAVPSAADAGGDHVCLHDTKDLSPCIADCDRGIASACAVVAGRMERGDGVPRDITRAATLHERACELREPGSCVTAARMFAAGSGVPPNRGKQMELLVAACKLGEASACSVPAKAFASGAGVTRDERRAHELWQHACAGGIDAACDAIADAGP